MTNVLIVLTLPDAIRDRYRDRIAAVSPSLRVNVVDHHDKVDPYIGDAEVLVTFGPMMTDRVFRNAPALKWVQALGSGVDGIVDQPSLRPGTIVTNIRGIHGAPVAEAALCSMLALARDLPRSVRAQQKHRWERAPSRTLQGKTVVIAGVGLIAEALAPRCKALGMQVVGTQAIHQQIGHGVNTAARERHEGRGHVGALTLAHESSLSMASAHVVPLVSTQSRPRAPSSAARTGSASSSRTALPRLSGSGSATVPARAVATACAMPSVSEVVTTGRAAAHPS